MKEFIEKITSAFGNGIIEGLKQTWYIWVIIIIVIALMTLVGIITKHRTRINTIKEIRALSRKRKLKMKRG